MRLVALMLIAASLTACSPSVQRSAAPADRMTEATIPNIPGARYWRSRPPENLLELEQEMLAQRRAAGIDNEVNILAISGGADDGAFGAGLLTAWTESGERPEFHAVTGISTGALIAPFAFLGPEYDHVIEELYTRYSTDDLVQDNGVLNFLLGGESAYETTALRKTLEKYVDDALLRSIAAQYRKGRFLFIGTTNLDAARPVTWNIGAIAVSGHPEALELVHEIILASTAIPIIFPPVLIDVEVDGEVFDEMHMDGGLSRQSFLFSLSSPEDAFDLLDIGDDRHAYVIRNSRQDMVWSPVDRSLTAIAGRSANSMVHSQGVGDLYREYIGAHKFGFDFNLAYIPSSFSADSRELFDVDYMRELYRFAYELAAGGYPWEKSPPGLE